MNDRQRLYFDQAKSDYDMFLFLEGMAVCHRLHYLQMCTEKLGKAYFYARKPLPGRVHTGFVKFLRDLSTKKGIWKVLGFGRQEDFESYIKSKQDLARQVENLAPTKTCAGDGPNPEYPWPPPPKDPIQAPVHYRFAIWDELENTGKGQNLQDLIKRIFQIFPDWF